jgi:predicted membrane GTPase involved in stress response
MYCHRRYVSGDELVEVTPGAVRIRKEILDSQARKANAKKTKAL